MKDIFAYKQTELLRHLDHTTANRGRVGLPLGLSMYEQLPLWTGFFESLGFEVILSDNTFYKPDINSNAVCRSAKLMYSRIESLLDRGVDFIFLPCENFKIDETCSDNYYNCPFVAYYPELLKVYNERLTESNFITPYLDLNNNNDTAIKLFAIFRKFGVKRREVSTALKAGTIRLKRYQRNVRRKAEEILTDAKKEQTPIIILAGRPYYLDNEITRDINKILTSLGFAVLSVDSIPERSDTALSYNEKLANAAFFAVNNQNVRLVQLVASGCKFDEVISDEVRFILESNGKPYTKIISDETVGSEEIKKCLLSLLEN